jgi:probable rRNA maturation factor
MHRAAKPYGLPPDALAHLAFVDDGAMRALNQRYRGIRRTTDVLAFGEALPPGTKGAAAVPLIEARRPYNGGRFDLGEVVISADQAARQARRARRPVGREVAFLAAHGVLHLLGYDDETPTGYREMVRLGQDAVRQKSVKR